MSSTSPEHENDRRDFAQLVEPNLIAMKRLAARLVAPADSDDIVQNALLRAWQRRATYNPDRGSATAWLLAIVRDQARRHRTRAPKADSQIHDGLGTSDVPESDLDIEEALAQLAPRQRLAVDLHYFVGLDLKSCAEVMDCAEGTVKATLHQARLRLHTILGEESNHDD